MPCEGCSVQFTVFRRKRCCADCKRFYCSNCLTTSSSTTIRNGGPLCDRCAIFAKRPLLKVDLLQLKPKDLIFYLQSKHISTAGCVEKDELVGLVLNHIQQADRLNTSSTRNSFSNSEGHGNINNNSSRNFDSSNSFDALKQSCQNFFSNISDKVDAFSFEGNKPTQTNNKPQQQPHNNKRSTSSTNLNNSHITEQPRVSTREIPTYASFQHRQSEAPADDGPTAVSNINTAPQSQNSAPSNVSSTTPIAQLNSSTSSSSSPSSPVVSLESNSPSQFATAETEVSRNVIDRDQDSLSLCTPSGTVHCLRSDDKIVNESASGCDCSDDEIITTFRARTSISARGEPRQLSPQSSSSLENPVAGPSGGSSNVLTSTSTGTKKSSPSLKIESYDESSESSFEELGAIGGISDDSKTAADSSAQTSEQWQFVEKDAPSTVDTSSTGVEQHEPIIASVEVEETIPLTVAVVQQPNQIQSQIIRPLPMVMRPKKVARRRSDGYLNRRRARSDDDDSPTSPTGFKLLVNAAQSLREEDEADNEKDDEDGEGMEGDENVLQMQDNRFNCKRCGKNRTNIKKHVEKMRRHLENSQMSEVDIKSELEEFLVYLEKRTKSIDCSDSETTAASSISGTREANIQLPLPMPSMSASPQFYNDNEGIHVYASTAGYQAAMLDSRFINLEDFETLEELETLSVKQLKEILMLNRVDYKGCCEKTELFDRVLRLWKNLKSTPAVERLPTDELCKICMDAPIECVILECGHMATCTSCGKVLSECPICRQYIVRVVRFFKA